MTCAYVLIFLTLFAILGDQFVQKVLYHQINQQYSRPRFEQYVHRSRPHMIEGINMRSLVKKNKNYQEIFSKLIDDVYNEAPFYTENLSEQLLSLFESEIVFKKSSLSDNKVYYSSKDDLDLLEVPKDFKETYLFLMRGSQIDENDKEGFPSLKTFFYLGDDVSGEEQLNLYNMPLQLIGSMFNKDAEEEMRLFRKNYKHREISTNEEKDFEKTFKKKLKLEHHKYSNLVGFKAK